MFGRPMSMRMISGRAAPIWLMTLSRLFREATHRIPSVLLKRLSRLDRRALLSSTMAILIMGSKMGKILEDYNRIFIGYFGRPARGSGSGPRSGPMRRTLIERYLQPDRRSLARRTDDPDPGIHHNGPRMYPRYTISRGRRFRVESTPIVTYAQEKMPVVETNLDGRLGSLRIFVDI